MRSTTGQKQFLQASPLHLIDQIFYQGYRKRRIHFSVPYVNNVQKKENLLTALSSSSGRFFSAKVNQLYTRCRIFFKYFLPMDVRVFAYCMSSSSAILAMMDFV